MTEKMRWRQIHLDFHTSEHCPDIAAGFDEEQFIGTLKLNAFKPGANEATEVAQRPKLLRLIQRLIRCIGAGKIHGCKKQAVIIVRTRNRRPPMPRRGIHAR